MFSSNQILKISGELDQLDKALRFALEYSGRANAMKQDEIDRGCKLLYQITTSGEYCIGWGFKKVPEGWCEYQFDFDIDIVSKIIAQHLKKLPSEPTLHDLLADGSFEKGFLMTVPHRELDQIDFKYQIIKNPFYCIVYFEPFTCFYAK